MLLFRNLKPKIISNPRSYNENYALEYLNKRKISYNQDKNFFENLFQHYNINISNEIILDLASGVGMDLKILNEFNPKKLIWHDKMLGVYKIAKINLQGIKNIEFNLQDIMDLNLYPHNSIKFAMCRDSLYYICNDFLFFQQINQLLKPDGFFWGINVNLNWYKKNQQKLSLIKKLRGLYFDWPLYKLTGLRIFSFTPVDANRLKYIFKKLNFSILYFKEDETFLEFLIKK